MRFTPALFESPLLGSVFVLGCVVFALSEDLSAQEYIPKGTQDVGVEGTLRFHGGEFMSGVLGESEEPGTLMFHAFDFHEPFLFDVRQLESFSRANPLSEPVKGQYRAEVFGGNALYGTLVSLDEHEFILDSTHTGLVRIRSDSLIRLTRLDGNANILYDGPTGLAGWEVLDGDWSAVAGSLKARKPSRIFGDFNLPAQFSVEIILSWESEADFALALGTSEEASSLSQAFRLDVWEREVVAQRETEQDIDLLSLGQFKKGPGKLHLHMYVDQEVGTLFVYSGMGQNHGSLKVSQDSARIGTGIYLRNQSGDLSLDKLLVQGWPGELPEEKDENETRIYKNDGTVIYGKPISLESDTGEVRVRTEDGILLIALSEIDSFIGASPQETAQEDALVVYGDGTRLSGNLTRSDENSFLFESPSFHEPFRMDRKGMVFMQFRGEANKADTHVAQMVGKFSGLRGSLVSAEIQGDLGALHWKPSMSMNSSVIRDEASCSIVFGPPAKEGGQEYPDLVYLRAGDTIPCNVRVMDEDSVELETGPDSVHVVPLDEVKAMQFGTRGPVEVSPSNRESLLQLTRENQRDPPTHILYAQNEDFLRGRLLGADDKTIWFDVRGRQHRLDRALVKAVICLYKNEAQGDASFSPAARPESYSQIVFGANERLSLEITSVSDDAISGVSPYLGSLRISRDRISRLLLGDAINQETETLAFQDWRWLPAVEVSFRAATDGAGANSENGFGLDSPWVGQEAPRFSLEFLDGTRFRFEDYEDKIVVLDFWATWCAPCIKSLPEVKAAVASLADKGVILIAVNVQESPEEIRAFLERTGMEFPIALDKDGTVGRAFNVRSLPQTVIIKDGRIARSQVGSLPNMKEVMTKALNEVITGTRAVEDQGLIGSQVSDFGFPLIGSTDEFRIKEQRGKVVVLHFWASWCQPCLGSLEDFSGVASKFGDEVLLIAVNQRQQREAIDRYLKNKGWNLNVGLDLEGKISRALEVERLPCSVVIGPGGTIELVSVGFQPGMSTQIEAKVRALLEPF